MLSSCVYLSLCLSVRLSDAGIVYLDQGSLQSGIFGMLTGREKICMICDPGVNELLEYLFIFESK